jgi:hypothetical protein
MKRILIVVALGGVAIAPVPNLSAQAYECIVTPKCAGLPCEFMAELKFSKAFLAAVEQTPASQQSSYDAIVAYGDKVDANLEQAQNEYYACSQADKVRDLKLNSDCRVFDGKAELPMTLDDVLAVSPTCSEVVEAEYAFQSAMAARCAQRPIRTPANFRSDVRNALSAKISSLEKALRRYLSSCAPDAKLAQEITDLGLGALSSETRRQREAWWATRWQNPAFDPGVTFNPK